MKTSLKTKLYGVSLAAMVVFTATQIQMFSSSKTARADVNNETRIQYYYVREYQGKVAVFSENEKAPDTVYDVYIENLPEKDKNLLKIGLRAESEEELQQIIEDYID